MVNLGLSELRRNVSEILRQVEAGDFATVTVSGRPVAEIVPLNSDQWVTWGQVKELFDKHMDSKIEVARKEFGKFNLRNPFES